MESAGTVGKSSWKCLLSEGLILDEIAALASRKAWDVSSLELEVTRLRTRFPRGRPLRSKFTLPTFARVGDPSGAVDTRGTGWGRDILSSVKLECFDEESELELDTVAAGNRSIDRDK